MSSFIGFVICVLILGGAMNMHLQRDREAAQAVMTDAQRRLALVKSAISDRQFYLETLKKRYELQRRVYDSNQALTEARSVMVEIQDAITSQKRVYASMVESRRESARGSTIEFLELADGRGLRSAKILNFDDTTLSLLTSDGILKVGANELPQHLKDYFRLDLIEPGVMQTMTSTDSFERSPAGIASAESRSAGGSFEYSSRAVPGPSAGNYDDSLKGVAANIKALSTRIQQLEMAKQKPLTGFDANLRSGSAAFKHRKKVRDTKLEQEISVLAARRNIFMNQQKQLSKVTSR